MSTWPQYFKHAANIYLKTSIIMFSVGPITTSKAYFFFLPQFIRRLLEHTSLLNLAYRMNSTNERKRTTEGEVVREGRRQWDIFHHAHFAAVFVNILGHKVKYYLHNVSVTVNTTNNVVIST